MSLTLKRIKFKIQDISNRGRSEKAPIKQNVEKLNLTDE